MKWGDIIFIGVIIFLVLLNVAFYLRAESYKKMYDESNQRSIALASTFDNEKFLNILRQELRGEQLYQDERGERYWVQTDKPTFIVLDEHDKPKRWINPKTNKEEYVINEDAINEVISIVKMCGLNPVAPLTTIDENEIRADLLEMESKIAVLLTIKRKLWGIDKAEYPVIVGKLKVIIKDARYRSKDGTVLRALRTITSRLEQSNEMQKKRSLGETIRSPFKD